MYRLTKDLYFRLLPFLSEDSRPGERAPLPTSNLIYLEKPDDGAPKGWLFSATAAMRDAGLESVHFFTAKKNRLYALMKYWGFIMRWAGGEEEQRAIRDFAMTLPMPEEAEDTPGDVAEKVRAAAKAIAAAMGLTHQIERHATWKPYFGEGKDIIVDHVAPEDDDPAKAAQVVEFDFHATSPRIYVRSLAPSGVEAAAAVTVGKAYNHNVGEPDGPWTVTSIDTTNPYSGGNAAARRIIQALRKAGAVR